MRRLGILAAAGLLLLAACGDDGGSGDDADVSAGDGDFTIPLSPADAADTQDGAHVLVEGYVLAPDQGDTVICERFGESFPPSCSGASLVVDGLDVTTLPDTQSTSGGDLVAPATWTNGVVQVEGTMDGGVLQVD